MHLWVYINGHQMYSTPLEKTQIYLEKKWLEKMPSCFVIYTKVTREQHECMYESSSKASIRKGSLTYYIIL